MELFRNFVFTLNNYSLLDVDALMKYNCRYMLFAKEIAPTTGTPHLQGYCELERRARFDTLVNQLPKGIHIEPRYGTQEQAIKYIKEPTAKPVPHKDDIYEGGEPRTQGTEVGRTALEIARSLLTRKERIDPIEHSIGTIKAYEKLAKYWPNSRSYNHNDLSRIWIHGPGRSGKTGAAYELCASAASVYKCDLFSKGWFDGYDNHEAVIIDDYEPFDSTPEQFKLLLSILDRYPLRVEVKGSSINWNPRIIVLTSQFPPWHYYNKYHQQNPHQEDFWYRDVQLRQLMGRLDRVIEFKGVGKLTFPKPEIVKKGAKVSITLATSGTSGTEKWQEDTQGDSLDVEVGSSLGQAPDAQNPNGEQEELGCPQGLAVSTRGPLADPN